LWWEYIIASDKYKELCKGKFEIKREKREGIHQYFTPFIEKKIKGEKN
jgi:hypothetical protein